MNWQYKSIGFSRSFSDNKIDGIVIRDFGNRGEVQKTNPFPREASTWTDRRACLAAQLGLQGWEMVNVDGDTMYFKRSIERCSAGPA